MSTRVVMVAWISALAAVPCTAQSFSATLSADTVAMGEVFELRVRLPVPANSVVYFPDTVATTDVLESYEPARWTAEPADGGGASLLLTYPVIAWGSAAFVAVSGFDVFVSPGGAQRTVELDSLPGGSAIGRWAEAPIRGEAFVRPLRVPRIPVWVNPVFTPEQVDAGVEPMPPADVVGASWHWPSVLAAFTLLAVLIGVARQAVVERRARAAGAKEVVWTLDASRRHALGEIDRLMAEKLHTVGRTHELYTRSSEIVRRYVERVDPRCGLDLTSSELMDRLEGRTNGSAGTALFREMGIAEVVKFGRMRPGGPSAEEHLASLRRWIADAAISAERASE